jgi:hypothetical protein
MARTEPLSINFDDGFVSDESRFSLGRSTAYRMKDWIPQLDAPLMKRGGWFYASPDLGTLGGTPSSITNVAYLPFANDGHAIALDVLGYAYQIKRFDGLGGALITNTGDPVLSPSTAPFWHKTGTKAYGIVLAGLTQGHHGPNKYFDTTGAGAYQLQFLGGTPPDARMGFSWGDYLALGNYFDSNTGFSLVNFRLAFSAVGDPDSWTYAGTNSSTMDFPEEIIAGVPLRNALLIFGWENVHIVTGDTPPPGGNLQRRTLFGGNGTFHPKSLATWRDYAIWANSSGVYQSDGATLTDLTYDGGITNYYRQVVSGFNLSQSWVAAGGIYRDHYILTITPPVGASVTLVCDLQRKVWTEWTNVNSLSYAHKPSGPGTSLITGDEELLFGVDALPRMAKTSTLWTPGITNGSLDANGVTVQPVLETPFYTMSNDALKRIRNLYIKYDLRTTGSTPPTLRVSRTFDPGANPTYTALTPDLLATTAMKRAPLGVRSRQLGVALKIAQVNRSTTTSLYSIEAEGRPIESSE